MSEKRKSAPRWTAGEDEIIRQFAMDGSDAIAERVGRTRQQVSNRAAYLGVKIRFVRATDWTEDEMDVLRSAVAKGEGAAMAALPHRTLASIRLKASRNGMKIAVGPSDGPRSGARTPQQDKYIGPRTVLARTCTHCGLFRAGKWFFGRSFCSTCASRNARPWRNARDAARKASGYTPKTQKLQDLTIPTATRKSARWTAEEVESLRPVTGQESIVEHAIRLKRTYYGTYEKILGTYGWTKINPPQEEWLIWFPDTPIPEEEGDMWTEEDLVS